MDWGAWRATVHGATKSLPRWSTHTWIYPHPPASPNTLKTSHSCFLCSSFPTPLHPSTTITFYGSFWESLLSSPRASLVAQMVNPPAVWENRVRSLVGKIPWRRKWQHTLVLLPGKFHGLRSLIGYSPWGHKELDTTEQLHLKWNARNIKTNAIRYHLYVKSKM